MRQSINNQNFSINKLTSLVGGTALLFTTLAVSGQEDADLVVANTNTNNELTLPATPEIPTIEKIKDDSTQQANFGKAKTYFVGFVNLLKNDILFTKTKKEIDFDETITAIGKDIINANNANDLEDAVHTLKAYIASLEGNKKVNQSKLTIYRGKLDKNMVLIYKAQVQETKTDDNHITLEQIRQEEKIKIIKNKLSESIDDLNLSFDYEDNIMAFANYKSECDSAVQAANTDTDILKLISEMKDDIFRLSKKNQINYLGTNKINMKKEANDFDVKEFITGLQTIKNDINKPITELISTEKSESFAEKEREITTIKTQLEQEKKHLKELDEERRIAEETKNNKSENKDKEQTNLEVATQKEDILKKKAQENVLSKEETEEKSKIEQNKLSSKSNIEILGKEIVIQEGKMDSLDGARAISKDLITDLENKYRTTSNELIAIHQESFKTKQNKTIEEFRKELEEIKKILDEKKLIKTGYERELKTINTIINQITEVNGLTPEIITTANKESIAIDTNNVKQTLQTLQSKRGELLNKYDNINSEIERIVMNMLYRQGQPYLDQNSVLKDIQNIKGEDVKTTRNNIGEITKEITKTKQDIEDNTNTLKNLTAKATWVQSAELERQRYETRGLIDDLKKRKIILEGQTNTYNTHIENQQGEITKIQDLIEYYSKKNLYLEYLGNCVILKNKYESLELEKQLLNDNIKSYKSILDSTHASIQTLENIIKKTKEIESTLTEDTKGNNLRLQYELNQEKERMQWLIERLDADLKIKLQEVKDIDSIQKELVKEINENIPMRNALIEFFKTMDLEYAGCNSAYCAPSIPQDILIIDGIIEPENINFNKYKNRNIKETYFYQDWFKKGESLPTNK